MNSVNYSINTGTGKNGNPWYMLTFTIGKYKSEPVFISELEHEYLQNYKTGQKPGSFLDDQEADE